MYFRTLTFPELVEGDGIDSTSSLPSLFVAVFAESVSADSLFNFKIKLIHYVLHKFTTKIGVI